MKPRFALVFILLGASCLPAGSQNLDTLGLELKVLARTSTDSIVLRWAPADVQSWLAGNRNGYQVERFTLLRDGKLLDLPEKKTLTPLPIMPWEETRWASIVSTDKYTAIAAQALFGDSFELTTEGTDVFQIVNKVKENEMRFAFALLAADLSTQTSRALGLRFRDSDVKTNEKYLYRISTQSGMDTIRGSVFVAPEKYELPPPVNFTAQVDGSIVNLRWDQSFHRGIYSSYRVERAADGKNFMPLSDEPQVTLTSSDRREIRFQMATDSLPSLSQVFYYRVRGLSPFGDYGPPSEVLAVQGAETVASVPYLTEGKSPDNQSVHLSWEFPAESEKAIRGFEVRRAASPAEAYMKVNRQGISALDRSYVDGAPGHTNYYQVVAIDLQGREYKSPIRYVQLVDSIPPLPPRDLKGSVNDEGIVTVSWNANGEADMYGYKVFKANNVNEEFAQITRATIKERELRDRVNVNTLSREIHYRVIAVDQSQNQSAFSEVLTLKLPDKVKPVPPFFYPFKADAEGVALQWTQSSSDDVKFYEVFRKPLSGQEWIFLTRVEHTSDTAFHFLDRTGEEGMRYAYTLFAVDESGLRSDPVSPIVAAKIPTQVKEAVTIGKPTIDREQKLIRLTWRYEPGGVMRYQVYRAAEGEKLKLYQTIDASQQEFVDKRLTVNTIYTYQVVAVFRTGARSAMGEKVIVNY